MIEIEAANYTAWQQIMRQNLATAQRFAIHCWHEENQWIELALRYGEREDNDWSHGQVIVGAVTEAFITMLLSQPEPSDKEIYDKRTPFFAIFLDNGFCSEHYGIELYKR